MKELKNKILEALVSALPITVIVYLMALTPLFGFSKTELITFTLGAIGLVMGVLVVLAEPAIHVLNQQVEDVTGGTVSRRSMMIGLCCGVGAAIMLFMIRIVFDFSLVYYIIPGYFISLFVPPVYTVIAFDSGGVASGPMTSCFILPFAIGACCALQGARGGTILNGRGVAREEAAAFFGIPLHSEKEILMMVVEKSIKNNILNAIYKEMGMGKPAQGIAFSLPVSDVAGLVKEPEAKE